MSDRRRGFHYWLELIQLSLGGAMLATCGMSLVAELAGYPHSTARDAVAAFAGFLTAAPILHLKVFARGAARKATT